VYSAVLVNLVISKISVPGLELGPGGRHRMLVLFSTVAARTQSDEILL